MQIHCMAHARWMFNEALDNDLAFAAHIMQEIQKLRVMVRNCKEQNLSFDAIKTVRQEQSVSGHLQEPIPHR